MTTMAIIPKIDGFPDDLVAFVIEAVHHAYIMDAGRFADEMRDHLKDMPTGLIAKQQEALGKLATAIGKLREPMTDELRDRVREDGQEKLEQHVIKFGPEERDALKLKRTFTEDGYEIAETVTPAIDSTEWKRRCPAEFRSAYDRGYVKESSRLTVRRKAGTPEGPGALPFGGPLPGGLVPVT